MRYDQSTNAFHELIAKAKIRLLHAERVQGNAYIRKEIAERVCDEMNCRFALGGYQNQEKLDLEVSNLELEIGKHYGIFKDIYMEKRTFL
ncbi:MAG: hypothetical protein JWM44_3809 [Bacilli bacterium]|nr:hypothetical protein [Bacilli bacterium]